MCAIWAAPFEADQGRASSLQPDASRHSARAVGNEGERWAPERTAASSAWLPPSVMRKSWSPAAVTA